MEWQFRSPDARSALFARAAFVEFMRRLRIPDCDCARAEIVFGELVTNVVRHAPGPIEITVQSNERGMVTMDVCDSGPGFSIEPALPVPDCESGRGVYIVSQLCEKLSSTKTGRPT